MTKTKRSKRDPAQASLPAAAFPPGPAELPPDPKPEPKPAPEKPVEKPAPPNGQIDLAKVRDMGDKFQRHAENLRALLADVQALAELGWPITDPDRDGNRVEQINALLELVEYETGGLSTILCDGTLAATIGDIQDVADDLSFGPNQAAWARAIFFPLATAEHQKPAGTPSKGKSKPTK
jgi:hypothetical protein